MKKTLIRYSFSLQSVILIQRGKVRGTSKLNIHPFRSTDTSGNKDAFSNILGSYKCTGVYLVKI